MSRRLLLIFAALVGLWILYKTNSFFSNSLLTIANSVKSRFLTLEQRLYEEWQKHFDQARRIETLQKRVQTLIPYQILYKELEDQLRELSKECNLSLPTVPNVQPVMAISYARLGDFTSMWLDATIPKGQIYGLLKNGQVAGIAIESQGRAKGLLNGNKQCSYGVVVGEKANGIAMGSGDNRYVIVKYIPNYEPIHAGQRVKTNGLDRIFVYGLDVGVVSQVWQEGSYKVAKVRTFADLSHPRFFWLMKL